MHRSFRVFIVATVIVALVVPTIMAKQTTPPKKVENKDICLVVQPVCFQSLIVATVEKVQKALVDRTGKKVR